MRQYTLSTRGLSKRRMFEGVVLHQYRDQAGLWTIGEGHLMSATEVSTGSLPAGIQAFRDSQGRWAITSEQATQLASWDMRRFERALTDLYRGPRELTDYEADALLLWFFNTGALPHSGVLRELNAGNYENVPTEMLRWNHRKDPKTGHLVVDEGLTKRRQAEVSIWLNGYDHPETDKRLQMDGFEEAAKRAFSLIDLSIEDPHDWERTEGEEDGQA